MNKAHIDINWENYPSDETPLNESNLNKMDAAIGVIDDRVITLDTTKATKTEVATLVADVTFEESTGIITITKKNGSKITIDTQMERQCYTMLPHLHLKCHKEHHMRQHHGTSCLP